RAQVAPAETYSTIGQATWVSYWNTSTSELDEAILHCNVRGLYPSPSWRNRVTKTRQMRNRMDNETSECDVCLSARLAACIRGNKIPQRVLSNIDVSLL